MTSVVAFVFVLGVAIFVHELGHFLAARRVGVRVLAFSLGFGPRLLSFTRGDTEYGVRAIPLGGYVRMAGYTKRTLHAGASDEFLSKTRWQRFQVLVMGPVMNLGLAWLLMAVVFAQGVSSPAFQREPAVVGEIVAGSAAAAAGLQRGDRIVAIDGRPIGQWADLTSAVAPNGGGPVTLDVDRAGQPLSLVARPAPGATGGKLGVRPDVHPEIDRAGDAARLGGLQPGDVILAVNGQRNPADSRILELLRSPADSLTFEVRRSGEVVSMTVPREAAPEIEAQLKPWATHTEYPGAVGALTRSARYNWNSASQILHTVRGLFTRDTPVSDMVGPIGIMSVAGQAARLGFLALLSLMALISLNLGLVNLMPIPVLDGGHIAILAVEGLAGRDVSVRVKRGLLATGFAVLATLMVATIYNDLMRIEWIERFIPWR